MLLNKIDILLLLQSAERILKIVTSVGLPNREERFPAGEALDALISTQTRTIPLFEAAHLAGKRILVTGLTGTVGAAVALQLSRLRPRPEIWSVTRGRVRATPEHLHVHYEIADVRDLDALTAVMRLAQPDVVIHLAAVRDPGYAETHVVETISTNVLGLLNVCVAASQTGVEQIVSASTGKALRFFTDDVYAASKMVGEYIAALSARSGLVVRLARFTHIVDNSLIWQKLNAWTRAGETIRLHSAESYLYAQSAIEAAQLLLALPGIPSPHTLVGAQTNLGFPVSLMQLARDVKRRNRSNSRIEVVGYEHGYEPGWYPGTYDPGTAGDFSPLVNSLEAARGRHECQDQIDVFALPALADEMVLNSVLGLVSVLDTASEAQVREQLHATGLDLMRWRLKHSDVRAVSRAFQFGETGWRQSATHDVIHLELRRFLDSAG